MNNKKLSYNKETRESILIDSFLVDILKYLSLADLARTRATSQTFHRIIDEESNIIFEKLNISISEEKINIDWLLNIIKNNRIRILNLLLCENFYYVRQALFATDPAYLEELKVPSKFFMSENDLIRFTRLKKLTIKNMYFSESGLSEDIYMISNLIQMPWIESIKLNNIKFVKATFMQYLTNKFIKMDFRESAEFKVEDMIDTLVQQSDTLKIFRLDGEFSNENVLKSCVMKLNNLTELYIGYCETFSSSLLFEIAKHLTNLNKLTLRKIRVKTEALQSFFEIYDLSKITKLDFYDCPHLNNVCANYIADKAFNLEFLELSWSTGIKNDSITKLIQNCPKLSIFYLQGCKLLDDKLFDQFISIEENTQTDTEIFKCNTAMNSLKLIDFSKCDLVQDSKLYKVMNLFPNLAAINYYGMNLKYEL